MKKIFLPFVLLSTFCLLSKPSFAQSAGLDLLPSVYGSDSVVIAAEMYTPQGVGFNMWAVTVALGYNPAQFYVTDARGIMNHFWAAQGWDSDSRPRFDTNGIDPDITFYAEAHPAMSVVQINQNARFRLCTFTFFPRSTSPGTATFLVIANRPTSALTGYWISTSSQNQPFNPAADVTNLYYPVELSAFSATQQGKTIVLRWRTESETGNYGFHVQRRDPLSDEWQTLDFVKGNGDSRQTLEYIFFDGTVQQDGWYEYRLQQQDFDGTTEYSRTTRVLFSGERIAFGLDQNHPNPISSSAGEPTRLRFGVEVRSRVRLVVTNTLGQVVDEIVNQAYDPGAYTAEWRPRNHPAGMYFATLTSESEATGTPLRAVVKMAVIK